MMSNRRTKAARLMATVSLLAFPVVTTL